MEKFSIGQGSCCASKTKQPQVLSESQTAMGGGEGIGFLAGILTTAANLPQVITTYKRKSGDGLSFRMLLTLAVGLILWVIYGGMNASWPLMVTNALAVGLVIALITMKFKYDRNPVKD